MFQLKSNEALKEEVVGIDAALTCKCLARTIVIFYPQHRFYPQVYSIKRGVTLCSTAHVFIGLKLRPKQHSSCSHWSKA